MKMISFTVITLLSLSAKLYTAESRFEKFLQKNEQQKQKLVETITASYPGSTHNLFEYVQFSAPFTSAKGYKRSRRRELALFKSEKEYKRLQRRTLELGTPLIEKSDDSTQRPNKKAKKEQQCGLKIEDERFQQALKLIDSMPFDSLEIIKQSIEKIIKERR